MNNRVILNRTVILFKKKTKNKNKPTLWQLHVFKILIKHEKDFLT